MRGVAVAVAALCACGRVSFEARIDADVDTLDVPPSGTTYVKADDHEAGDRFDMVRLSADGRTMVVGAGWSTEGTLVRAGAAYVFEVRDGQWEQTARLVASNPGASDWFGYRNMVALSADGNTIAIGADQEDSAATDVNGNQADESATDAGAVYVFVRGATGWEQQAYLKAPDVTAGDQLGAVSLSADGNTLAVGSPGEDSDGSDVADESVASAGAVYIYERSGETWSRTDYVKAMIATVSCSFGTITALSDDGQVLAVSAQFCDPDAINGGQVYMYRRSGDVWIGEDVLRPNVAAVETNFGYSLALAGDGSTLVVGTPNDDSAATGIDGDETDVSAPDAGALWVYTYTGSWTQQAYVKMNATAQDDGFGWSAALSRDGNTLAAGAVDAAADNSGVVALFTRSGTQWSFDRALLSPAPTGGDAFGVSVALSADGATIAVGVRGEDSAAQGINGDGADNSAADAGAVYVFR